jgi:uncharacterized cupredoxin-like copper-binding protein
MMRIGNCRRRLLLALAVLSLAPAATAARIDWAKARLVTVTAVDYRFIPNHLVFHRGVPYHLHVVNRGKEMHELHAPDFFNTAVIRNPTALNQEHSELVLDSGATKDLYLVAERRGRYDMRCPDHDWAGMTGDITVK